MAAKAETAESLGYDFVGITDGQMIWRDVYVCLALAARATSRVRIGPWVTNPITRHPTATANAICTIDELSDGRAFLGIGVGDDAVHTIGKKPMALRNFVETLGHLRRLMAGERIEFDDGRVWELSTAREQPPPIYWAAAGPKSLRLAGEHADGVIHSGWLVPSLMREDLSVFDEGVRTSGRAPGDVSRIFNTAVAISHDRDEALHWASPYAARAFIYPSSARVPGWSEEDRQSLAKEYDYYGHFSERQPAQVSPDLRAKKVVTGTPAEAVAMLEAAAAAGYSHAALIPMGDVERVMHLLATEVLPEVRQATTHGDPAPGSRAEPGTERAVGRRTDR